MSLYGLKVRASQQEQHVSGTEFIERVQDMPFQMEAALMRALHHSKGYADFINMKIEEI